MHPPLPVPFHPPTAYNRFPVPYLPIGEIRWQAEANGQPIGGVPSAEPEILLETIKNSVQGSLICSKPGTLFLFFLFSSSFFSLLLIRI